MAWTFDNRKPIYMQLLEGLKLKIISGEMKPGEKFPTVRSLAEEAEINPNTVQRALAELEREGLIYADRTKGRFVTDDCEKIEQVRRVIALNMVQNFKDMLLKMGYDEDEIIKLISQNIKEDENAE